MTLTRFLKDQLIKFQDYYQNQSSEMLMTEEQKLALKQWQYCVRLAKYLYEVRPIWLVKGLFVLFLMALITCEFTRPYLGWKNLYWLLFCKQVIFTGYYFLSNEFYWLLFFEQRLFTGYYFVSNYFLLLTLPRPPNGWASALRRSASGQMIFEGFEIQRETVFLLMQNGLLPFLNVLNSEHPTFASISPRPG